MVAPRIILEILSPLPLTKREDGHTILKLWKAILPDLLPTMFGNWEPIDRPFDVKNLAVALDSWKWPFLAIRDRPNVNCGIWMRKSAQQQLHSTLVWDIAQGAASQVSLLRFLEETAMALEADFACLHMITDAEIERGLSNRTVTALDKKATRFNFFLASKDLKRRIPDLFWATVLGPPYVEMFGRERLHTAPAHLVKSLSDDAIMLQMTENLLDVNEKVGEFNEVRSLVKQYLAENAFYQASNEANNAYRIPNFCFV